jgi:cysteine desulfurase
MKHTSVYLDFAAATPMDSAVLAAMQPYFSEKFYNPSAIYLAAKQVSADIADARKLIAKWLGCQPGELYFTAGGTEANNLAIQGVMRAHPGANMVYSAIEHDSVMEPAQLFGSQVVSVDTNGQVDIQQLADTIDDKTVLVSIMLANNEIGAIQPLPAIAERIQLVRKQRQASGNALPLYLHTDACQAATLLQLHIHRLGVDLMTINGGKMYGPKQSGVLMVRTGTKIEPFITGGGQERGLRSGTENVAGIVGLAQAFDLVQTRRQAEFARLEELQQLFITNIVKQLPKAQLNGGRSQRLVNNVNFSFPGHDNERLLMELDERGVMCAAGSACSASSEEPSHVLAAIGLPEDRIRSSLRFSFGRDTTAEKLDYVVAQLKDSMRL